MKELNKLIEGIAFPLRYEESNNGILDANNQWVCEVYGGLADGSLIAHALNNLDATHHPTEVSAGHQPKEGEPVVIWGEPLRPSAKPVSGERTGEEGERLLFDVISSIEQFGEVPDDLMRRAKEAVKYE